MSFQKGRTTNYLIVNFSLDLHFLLSRNIAILREGQEKRSNNTPPGNAHLLIRLPPISMSWGLIFPSPCGSGGPVHQWWSQGSIRKAHVPRQSDCSRVAQLVQSGQRGPIRVLFGTWKVGSLTISFSETMSYSPLGLWACQSPASPVRRQNLPENEGNITERRGDPARVLITSVEGLHSFSPITTPWANKIFFL